jgi:CubicO group peptidase (beta-lactamase class C family)
MGPSGAGAAMRGRPLGRLGLDLRPETALPPPSPCDPSPEPSLPHLRPRLLLALAGAFSLFAAAAAAAAPDLDAVFADLSASGPGCAAGAERGGQVLFARGFGTADLEDGRPLTPTSRFYMASVSKQVAALTVLELVRAGRLSLDASITTYIPELPAYLNGVTIEDLLTHTSGVRDYFALAGLAGTAEDHAFTEADVIAAVSAQKALNFPRGTAFLYSNSGYVLLSIAAERVAHESFDALARAELFAPLGMTDTFFQHHHDAPVPQRAHGYAKVDGAWRISDSRLDVVGDGGLYSDVSDMLKWLSNLDSGVAGAASLKEMQAPAKTLDGKLTGYGMGLEVGTYRGLPLIEHGGALAGYRTADLWFPSEKFGAVVLCNFAGADPSRLARKIAALYLPALADPAAAAGGPAPPPAPAPSAAELAPFVGTFAGADGFMAKIVLDHDRLLVANLGAPLTPKARGVFVLGALNGGRTLVFSGETPPQAADLVVDGVKGAHFQRVLAAVPDKERAALIGDYASSELGAVYHITSAGAGLLLAVGAGPPAPLDAIAPDRFLAEGLGAELVLTRGAGGAVLGFKVSNGRARGLVFQRS